MDLISRKTAIERVTSEMCSGGWCQALEALNNIPAVSIVYCKDCKHNMLKEADANTLCDLGMELHQKYDFCSMGEKKW